MISTISLGELAQIDLGIVFPNIHQGHTEGDLPFAKVGDISSAVDGGARRISTARNYISNEAATRMRARPFPAGTIVFAKIGELIRLNNRAITTRSMLFDNNVMGVTPRQEVVDLDYLFFFLQTLDFYSLANITAVPAIRKSDLEELPVPLVTIDDQKRIARVLNEADSLRRARRYALQMCDEFLPAVFLEMFGDLKSSESRWPVQSLGESLEAIEGGINFNPVGESEPASNWRVLKVSAVSWREFLADESKPISPTEQFDEKLIVKLGDLIMSRANTTDLVGAVARVRRPPPKVLLPDKLWRLKFATDAELLPDFVLYALRCGAVRREIEIRASGTSGSMKNISKEDASSLRLPYPPLPVQQQFVKLVARHEQLRATHVEALRQAEHLFQTLLHQAFSTQ